MKKVIDYDIVQVKDVKQRLAEGWDLFHAPFAAQNSSVYQAMVKFEVVEEWVCGHKAGAVCAECYRILAHEAHRLAEEVIERKGD